MPWQVIDLEESSDKAIHKPVVDVVMYFMDFLPQRPGLLSVAIHSDWQQLLAHCSSTFERRCLDHLRVGLYLVSSACPIILHNTIIIPRTRCFNLFTILVPLVWSSVMVTQHTRVYCWIRIFSQLTGRLKNASSRRHCLYLQSNSLLIQVSTAKLRTKFPQYMKYRQKL